ncbi:MAG: class I SAM-dependent methyltransferase family protein [Aigarchaeota archaeon]|nr:class I SAM-dependent methyltransferase family protein [Aigarchaeota archaeon]MCX8193131.1 class I SAM-dependent methyltransferase family protein [Nitrososphaeria archaeon]MDW7986754.1 class I SAM-dependent methyltransferase family protein [Nitrososphaerota archaeon]
MKFKDYLAEKIPEAPKSLLPSRARIIDKIAILRISSELEPWFKEISRLALQYYPRVRAVYRWIGVEGIERRPIIEHLAGERVRVVEHKEYGWKLRLDIERLMLCLGNSYERLRIARIVSNNEIVVDMFAGVGQFTIPIAVIGKPRKIYSVEINPEAYSYLVENILLNRVQHIVDPILGDCKKIVGEEIKEIADRVVMGYFGGTIEALPQALEALKPIGGIIHFHELVRRGREEDFIYTIKKKVEEQGYWIDVKSWRIVKSYSKTRNHIVIDIYARRTN